MISKVIYYANLYYISILLQVKTQNHIRKVVLTISIPASTSVIIITSQQFNKHSKSGQSIAIGKYSHGCKHCAHCALPSCAYHYRFRTQFI